METERRERRPYARLLSLLMTVLAACAWVAVLGPASAANAATTIVGQLAAGGQLQSDDSLVSPNRSFRLVMQTDGNLVEYGPRGPIWATYSSGTGARLVNQSDGNIVVYGPDVTWASGTAGQGPATLAVQDDGNVVAYGGRGAQWSTYTDGGRSKIAATGAIAFARQQLGKSYVYGHTGPNDYDCSGLTMMAYASVGVTLPRTSQQQSTRGVPVGRDALQPGDLVFYNSASHVGIYIGNGQIINALGSPNGKKYGVRIDNIDFPGAYYGARRVS